MNQILDVANATWTLKKWMDENEVPKKVTVKKSILQLESALTAEKVELLDLTGKPYQDGMFCEILNEEDYDEAKSWKVKQMLRPIVYRDGNLIQYGQAFLEEANEEEL